MSAVPVPSKLDSGGIWWHHEITWRFVTLWCCCNDMRNDQVNCGFSADWKMRKMETMPLSVACIDRLRRVRAEHGCRRKRRLRDCALLFNGPRGIMHFHDAAD